MVASRFVRADGAVPTQGRVAGALPETPHRRSRGRVLFLFILLLLTASISALVYQEVRSSRLQSWWLSRYADQLGYSLQAGGSPAIHYPRQGPFDRRMGYAYLPDMLPRLSARGYGISAQVRQSPALMRYDELGLFPPYPQKAQAGLSIRDCRAEPLYRFLYPAQGYGQFRDIPPLVVDSLLFVENRELLKPGQPFANPAVDWPRFTLASLQHLGKNLGLAEDSVGGSTLATQIEKFRHSPDGLTLSAGEKLRQMASASVRAYQAGPETGAVRQAIVRDYLNSVPLSAVPGYGEVHGLADGLKIWFGADFATVNRLLREDEGLFPERGLALRQVISLIIAQRRPSYYLAQGRAELNALVDSHLRVLAGAGVIAPSLRNAALEAVLRFRDFQAEPALNAIQASKGINLARRHLSDMLARPLYDLDRLDLSASTPLQGELQEAASLYLRALAAPAEAERLGLFGERLLKSSQVGDVRYSFTLFENTGDSFRVRAQTDNTDQPFDINEGSKLELGSTAKLRVLTTYLEIVAELHDRYAHLSANYLKLVELLPQDHLSRWAVDYLAQTSDRSLPAMLEAALERRYSASPGEYFFTGGGRHSFSNFKREDNGRVPTVREALRESINLPFVRLLRDIVRYTIYQPESGRAELLKDDRDSRRLEYLRQFADREGQSFLLRFWKKYRGKPTDERLKLFWDGLRPGASRLAAVHRYLLPEADYESFATFLKGRLPAEAPLTEKRLAELYKRYGPGAYSLPDQGFIARVHPLELWLLGYLVQHPEAPYKELVTASADVRQEVYGWLFKSRHKRARDSRIAIMLEVEAFLEIHQRWQRVGYPFEHLVPSLATALGSSGDRPAALAELMGIIQGGGLRLPVVRIDSLHFAADTPYETRLSPAVREPQRVLKAEVAAALRGALSQVVEGGTARRLAGTFQLAGGQPLAVGGKTGTGDNRIEATTRGGHVLSSRILNRTATFVFFLGDKHFGTLTAFVPGESAQGLRFTSALPVQVLKGMAPILQPYLEPGRLSLCQPLKSPAGAGQISALVQSE
ncbi:MAG: penicillin-binding protein [Gammaproteobacteria bacterium]|nr:penicillin-binding protein [Gammaproteobacteria bacterium]